MFFDPRTRENMLLTTPVLAECEIIDARFRGIQRELAEPMARDDSHIVLTSYMIVLLPTEEAMKLLPNWKLIKIGLRIF